MVDKLFELSRFYLKNYNKDYKRYFLKKHPMQSRFYIILGQRGIGKTTALIQHMLDLINQDTDSLEALYVPVDHTYVTRYTLYDIAETFYKEGVKYIFFDEIHKYAGGNWSQELKSIYDVFTEMKILSSGSSAKDIYKSSHDLSRRAIVYQMRGMSFREFLELTLNLELPPITLETLIDTHEKSASAIMAQLAKKEKRVLPLFRQYLSYGYYHYFNEHMQDMAEFHLKLEQDVNKTILSDSLTVYPNLNGSSVKKVQRLLGLLTGIVPYTPDLNDLKRKLEIGDIRTLKQYLKFLEDAQVICSVSKKGRGFAELEKPDKLYLDNTNLIHALGNRREVDKGSIRETFFANAVSSSYRVNTVHPGDFLVDGTYTFEVGGKNKRFSQVKGIDNAFLAINDIETGIHKEIPLWLFGFLY